MKEKRSFGDWFVNVFWYHYGKLALAGIAALAVIIWLSLDALHKEEYDLNVVVVKEGQMAEADVAALNDLLEETVGDISGDGQCLINIQRIDASDGTQLERILLYQSLPEYTLFIMDDRDSLMYGSKEGTFQPLSDYGLEGSEEAEYRVYAGDRAVLKHIGKDSYLCLSDWTVDGKGSSEMTEAAVRSIKAILSSPALEEN